MKQILLITYDNCDDTECYYPLMRMREEGYAVTVASLEKKTIHGKHWFTAEANLLPQDIRPADYDALMLPGGTAPEKLRQNGDILCAVRAFMTAGKPVAAICHGPQLLISAGVLGGRHCTCYPGIRDDLVNAGALYENAPVVIDGNLITSRRPDDLPDFMRAFIQAVNQIETR